MIEILENVYSDRNTAKREKLKGEGGLFTKERGVLFARWIGTGKKIIDLGCRDCSLTKWFLQGNDLTGFDVDSRALKVCPHEVKTEQHDLNGDWHKGREGQFDIVVSSEVVEHLYYPEEVLKKIKDILKPGGYFMGSVPNGFNLKNRIRLFLAKKGPTTLGEPTHINHFSYDELKTLLSTYFSEVEIVPIVQKKWLWLAKIFPGLASFIFAFKAKKN